MTVFGFLFSVFGKSSIKESGLELGSGIRK
jgi:hypothetical protein